MTKHLSELRAEDQQQVGRGIEMLGDFIDWGQRRMKSYRAGCVDSGIALKLIVDLKSMSAIAGAMVNELIEKHGIYDPEHLRRIDEITITGMREVLTELGRK